MKISLREESGVAVLEVEGAVDEHNFAVLRAGIGKLFRSGKNRIVLSLADATEISGVALRELAMLDVTARELAGQIVLAAAEDSLKESVRRFAKPPVIPIVSTVEQGIAHFRELTGNDAADPDTLRAFRERAETAERATAAVRAELAALDPRALADLRAENERLRAQVATLEAEAEDLAIAARVPAAAYREKIAVLEDSVRRLSGVDHG